MFDLKITDATILEQKDGEHRIYIRAEVMAPTAAQHDLISKILNADSRITSTKTGKAQNGLDVIEILITASDDEINPKDPQQTAEAIVTSAVEAAATVVSVSPVTSPVTLLPAPVTSVSPASVPTGEDLDTVMVEELTKQNTMTTGATIPKLEEHGEAGA